LIIELPGDSEAWGAVFGPVPLAVLSSLFGLAGAALICRRKGRREWLIPMAPLALGTPLLMAYEEGLGYLVMLLLLDPLALWVWLSALGTGYVLPSPRETLMRGVVVIALLPVVWVASCTYRGVGVVNERIAELESVPVPAGSVVVEKDVAAFFRLMGSDRILYRVPMPLKRAEAEVYRVLREEGWLRRGENFFGRDGNCFFVFTQIWTWTPDWSSSDNTFLQISLADPENCVGSLPPAP
jgi:hypothetical protein